MIVLSPPVWPGPDSQGSPSSLTFPGLVTIPIGFLGCWLGTMLGSATSEDERSLRRTARALGDRPGRRGRAGLGRRAGSGARKAEEPAPVR